MSEGHVWVQQKVWSGAGRPEESEETQESMRKPELCLSS